MGKAKSRKKTKSKSKTNAPPLSRPTTSSDKAPSIDLNNQNLDDDDDESLDLDLKEYKVGSKSLYVTPLRVQVPAVAYLLKKYGKYLVVNDEDDEEDDNVPIDIPKTKAKKHLPKNQAKSKGSHKKAVQDSTPISKTQKRKSNVLDEESSSASKIPAKQNRRQTRSTSIDDIGRPEDEDDCSPKQNESKAIPNRLAKGKGSGTSKSELPKKVCLNTDFIRRLIRRKEPTAKATDPEPEHVFENDDYNDDLPSPSPSPTLVVPEARSSRKTGPQKQIISNNLEGKGHQDHKCKFCSKVFQSNAILNMHLKKAHDPTKVLDNIDQGASVSAKDTCEICQKEFHSIASLNMHRKKEHKTKSDYSVKSSNTCRICKFSFLSKSSLDLHMSEIHRMNSDVLVEDFDVPQIVNVTGNAVMKPPEPVQLKIRYTCPYPQCQKQNLGFGTIEELKEHEDNSHKPNVPESYPCTSCSSIFTNQISLKAHIRLRHNVPAPKINKIICTRCDNLTFPSSDCLERHNNLMHTNVQPAITSPTPLPRIIENKFKCLVCSADFADSALFRNHLLSHTRQFLTRSRTPGELGGGGKITQSAEISSTMSAGTPLSHNLEDSLSPPIINLTNDDADVEIIEVNPPESQPSTNALTGPWNARKGTKSGSSSDEFEGHEETGHRQQEQQTFYCTNCWPRLSFSSLQDFNQHNNTFHAPKATPLPPQATVPATTLSVTPILSASSVAVPNPKPKPPPYTKPLLKEGVKKAIKCPLCPKKQFKAIRYLKQHINVKHRDLTQSHRKNLWESESSDPYIPNNMLDVSITSEEMILEFDDQLLSPEAQEEQPVAITPSSLIIGTDFDGSSENTVQGQPEIIIMDEFESGTGTTVQEDEDVDEEEGNFTFNIVNHPPPDLALN